MNSVTELARLLTEALERLGIEVQRVHLDEHVSGGGLCTIKGKRMVLLDRHNSIERDIEALTEALAGAYTGDGFLPPLVRDWLDKHASSK
jgi:hypothetical protein